MMKTFYVIAWVALVLAAMVSIATGEFGAAALMAFSLVSLGLFFAFALWAVTVNNPQSEMHRHK